MLTAFAIEGFAELKALMEKRRDEAVHPAERAAAVGAGYLEFALKNPESYRVMFRAELLNEQDPAYQAANFGTFAVLEAAIREGQGMAPGEPDEATLPQRCLLAWCTVHGYATLVLEGAVAQAGRSEKARLREGMDLGKELIRLLGPSLFPNVAWMKRQVER